MATAELDLPRLSSFCSLPQTSLTTLLDAPTVDLVRQLLKGLLPPIREQDELKADKLKLNVELENAVRGGESKARVLKNSVDKGLKEAAELRQRLQEAEQSKIAVQSELESLRSSTANSSSEITTLKTRISSLESSNRDTLSLLESKSTAYDKLADELTIQHQKSLDLRKEVSALEQKVQSAEVAASTANYHEQSLQQEIEQLKRNNDWLDRELKAKTEEHTKFRKDKGARISELQRDNEEAANALDAARRTEQALRNRIEELSQKTEEYLSRIQHMSEESMRAEESFQKSAESNKRLLELTQNSASTDRARLQEVQAELEATRDNAQEQISRLASELQTESDERVEAERRIAELETKVERLEAEIAQLRTQEPADTPLHDGVNGQPSTPGRANSPASSSFSPARSRLKGGLSMTQLYSQNSELKSQLSALRKENERLSASVDEMLQDAESMRPEIEEVRTEKAQLESSVAEMSSLVDHMGKERDQAVKNARKAAGQIEARVKEGEVLRQQLRDLSTQIKLLLFELDRREKGLDSFNADQQLQLEELARGDTEAANVTATDRFIAAELVMFRNTAELQEQNNKLLKLTRELGARMEHEEAMRIESDEGRDRNDYKQLYEQCQDEVKSLLTQSQSYIRERDMFRRMLTNGGQLARVGDADSMFAESINGGAPPVTPSQSRMINSVEQSPHSKDMSDYAKLLKEMQTHFDNYRKEAATDHKTLKEQVDKLSSTNGELRTEVARCNGQVTVAHERYQMLQSNYAMLKNENSELQKRSQFFSDNAAKQDMRTQQVAEDLVEAKGLLDSMRNENANLRAEKEFFKTIEKRLTADYEAQLSEKARLNNLNVSLQNLINEREQTDGENRRKLQNRVDTLDQDLQNTKRALSEQTEDYKRMSDRREYEQQQSQKKIDDLIASLSSVREEFAAAKTARDHLQARVEELAIELRSAEERVRLLQPATSARPEDRVEGRAQHGNSEEDQSSLGRERELAIEVSELKRDIDLAKAELENAKGQVEQYKSISQSSEEELQSLNETQDLYRQDMDKILGGKDAKIQQLEQRVNDTHAELMSTNTELGDLRGKEAEIDRQLQEQKAAFEAEIARLKEQDERHATAAQYHQEDLKAQAEIAQQAQQNYENELVKHAEAAKALQRVRSDFNDLKIQVVELRTEAQSAQATLAQSEESWLDAKARYEQELADMREGRQSLTDQNNRLHQQLETLSIQIANLQQRSVSDDSDQPEDQATSSSLANLQEVIRYLRREKEIVDVQFELSAQEGKRLKQQLDYTQSQLDDTRLKLNQQRRVEQDSERSSLNHNKLMDTINELNTFRESNVTLRNESRHAQAALAQKMREVEQLVAQIEPLQTEVRELKSQKETQAEETRLLHEDRDRWRQRTQDILQKYDRVDPAELEALKSQLQTLEGERDELLSSKQMLQEQVDGIEGQIAQVQEQNKEKIEELRSRLTDQFKTRSKNLTGTIREKDASLQQVTMEKQDLEQRLLGLQRDLEQAHTEKEQAVQSATKADASATTGHAQTGSEDGQVDEDESSSLSQAEVLTLQQNLGAAETRAHEEATRSAGLQNDVAAAQSRVSELEGRIREIQQELDAADQKVVQLQTEASQNQNVAATNSVAGEEVEKLRQDLAQAQQNADDLRAATSIQAPPAEENITEGGKSIADQISEIRIAIQAELEARHSERVQKAEETLEKRTQAMKKQLSTKLTEGKDHLRREKDEALQEIGETHRKELEELNRRHQDELNELRRQEETKFAEFKKSWAEEHQSKEPAPELPEKKEAKTSAASWVLSDAEARDFVASNTTVKNILMRNISQKVAELKVVLKEEHVKDLTVKLEEAQAKANIAREQAVAMEGKKNAVKVNILESKTKTYQFRLDIVSTAAKDTPSKPVFEVWEIAKTAKPASSTTTQQPPNPSSIQSPLRTGGASQNASAPQQTTGSPQTQAPPKPTFFGQPTPLTSVQQPQVPLENAQRPSGQAPTPQAEPSPKGPSQENGPDRNQDQPSTTPAQPTTTPQQLKESTSTDQQAATSQPPSNVPIKQQPQGPASNHPNAGTGPAALRGLHQSGLPVARGGNFNRGGRGRGQSGRGRGGPANTNHPQNQNQATASPTQLSGAAKQFVPQGNKRPRDDGEGGGQQRGEDGNGKRIRGGAGGA
ncbi:MAG: hypothetical protein LQ343_005025 [Gyalolechia ehrenbergii]|nr:MAG: hypothetical protein LQ343_005025 [Gyalolechia ehrenbergii]